MPLEPPPLDQHGNVIPHDHPGIGSTDGIIRRISQYHVVIGSDGRKRLSSRAFDASSDTNGGMSVDLQAQIEEAGLNCREYVTSPVWFGSVRFEAGALRRESLQVGFHPIEQNPYHGEIWGNFSSAMKRRILPRLATWFVEIEGVAIST